MALVRSRGRVTLLRVHDVGSRYGPPDDSIDAEVVFQLHSRPGEAFGFQLRDDGSRPVRQGMLDLLRDAFTHQWDLEVVFDRRPGRSNSVAHRLWVTRPATPPGGITATVATGTLTATFDRDGD